MLQKVVKIIRLSSFSNILHTSDSVPAVSLVRVCVCTHKHASFTLWSYPKSKRPNLYST